MGEKNFKSKNVIVGYKLSFISVLTHFPYSTLGHYCSININQPPPPPPDDHGNSCSAATAVNVNSSTAGTINSAGDWDYFRVQVPSSGTLTVYTTGSTDTYGFLKNASCADLTSNDAYNGDRNFRIIRSVTAGTYYVAVRHYNTSTGTGAYTLNVGFSASTPPPPDDHGNSCSAATAVNVNSSTAGTINSAGDWDYFRVQVPSSGTLTVYTTGSIDTYGYLKNSNCTDITGLSGHPDNYNGSPNFRLWGPVTAGTYYVAVRHYSSMGTGAYTLNVSFTPSVPTSDRFTWPVDPTNPTDGHVNSGGLTQCQNSLTCYWLSDTTENTSTVWYDAQGFQRYNWSGWGWHLGADYNKGADIGKPVYPTAPGTVSRVIEDTCSWGRIVLVRHTTSSGPYTSMYAHVNWGYGKPYQGQPVSPSTPIATVGNGASDNCSTPRYPYHLHFEIRRGDSVVDFPSYPQGPGYWDKRNLSPCNGSDSSSNNCPQHQVDPNAFIRAHN